MDHEPKQRYNKDFTSYMATDAKISWVEGVAILVAVIIVVLVGSINDYQKEAQFRKLNAKKEDREVKVNLTEKNIPCSPSFLVSVCCVRPVCIFFFALFSFLSPYGRNGVNRNQELFS